MSTKLSYREFLLRTPRNIKELAAYAVVAFGFRIPYPSCPYPTCKDHSAQLTVLWDMIKPDRPDELLIHATRSSGKTLVLSMFAFIMTVTTDNLELNVFGGSLSQSTQLTKYIKTFFARPYAPRHLLENNQVTATGYKLTNGSSVTALAASSKAARSPHPQFLVQDEIDEMSEELYEATLGQPTRRYGIKPFVVKASTEQYEGGLMSRLIEQFQTRTKAGDNIILHEWCINDVIEPWGWMPAEDAKKKKNMVSIKTWELEYTLTRKMVAETLVFNPKEIARAYELAHSKKWGHALQYTWEIGIDWGYNHTIMHLILCTKDMHYITQVWEYERMDVELRIDQMLKDIWKLEVHPSAMYTDSNPVDTNLLFIRKYKEKLLDSPILYAPAKIIPVQFAIWKKVAVKVLQMLFNRNSVGIYPQVTRDKLKLFEYDDKGKETFLKHDDHHTDSLIAWASSKYKYVTDTKIPGYIAPHQQRAQTAQLPLL